MSLSGREKRIPAPAEESANLGLAGLAQIGRSKRRFLV